MKKKRILMKFGCNSHACHDHTWTCDIMPVGSANTTFTNFESVPISTTNSCPEKVVINL